jgi:hypothetical protein
MLSVPSRAIGEHWDSPGAVAVRARGRTPPARPPFATTDHAPLLRAESRSPGNGFAPERGDTLPAAWS